MLRTARLSSLVKVQTWKYGRRQKGELFNHSQSIPHVIRAYDNYRTLYHVWVHMPNLLTTVLPLFILWVSLWAWAQKSTQAVTPEKGRPFLQPSRQSLPASSFSTCKEMKGRDRGITIYLFGKHISNLLRKISPHDVIYSTKINTTQKTEVGLDGTLRISVRK